MLQLKIQESVDVINCSLLIPYTFAYLAGGDFIYFAYAMKYFVAINFAIDFNNTYLRKRICPEEIEKGSSRSSRQLSWLYQNLLIDKFSI